MAKEPTKAMSLRLDDAKMAELHNVARVEGTTVSEVVRDAIRGWIDSRGTDPEFQRQVKKKLEEDIAIFKRLAGGVDDAGE
jgi:Arc/MetJ-type ribon-helix-helix transcriptional regulator